MPIPAQVVAKAPLWPIGVPAIEWREILSQSHIGPISTPHLARRLCLAQFTAPAVNRESPSRVPAGPYPSA